ncbi:MAG: hypothetical protein N2C14_07525 [Planctomycetales bacterium]
MNQSLTHSLVSLAAVLIVFKLYELVIVPWIEPTSVERFEPTDDDHSPRDNPEQFNARMKETLRTWFAPARPGDDPPWELSDRTKILQSPQGILVFEDYSPLPDGSMRITPFSMVFLPRGDEDPARSQRDAIVLRAPRGAVLRFDRPLDLQSGSVGKPIGGKLLGPVTIFSDQKSPGPEDDLSITTSNLDLRDEFITTHDEVYFTLGPNRGQGTGLRIELLASKAGGSAGRIQGVKRLELRKDVVFRLESSGKKRNPVPRGGRSHPIPQQRGEVTVSAQGQPSRAEAAFDFNFVANLATFRHNVSVFLDNPLGADQLTCEALTLRFQDPKKPAAGKTKQAKLSKSLEFQQLIAEGYPVKIHSPSRQAEAECDVFVWDEAKQELYLGRRPQQEFTAAGSRPPPKELIVLRQESQLVRSAELRVRLDAAGQIQEAECNGPGMLTAQHKDRGLRAQWTRRMQFRPEGKFRLLLLAGQADLASETSGRLQGKEIRAWLRPEPGKPNARKPNNPNRADVAPSMAMKPYRLTAVSDKPRGVILDSKSLTAHVNLLDVWFKYLPAASKPQPPAAAAFHAPSDARPATAWVSSPRQGFPDHAAAAKRVVFLTAGRTNWRPSRRATESPNTLNISPVPNAASISRVAQGPALGNLGGESKKSFDVRAKTLVARINMRGRRAELSEAKIDGDARVVETQAAGATDAPLRLSGEHLLMKAETPEQAVVHIKGSPARVEGRNLFLEGQDVQLDRGNNVLTVNGAGKLRGAVNQDPQGNPTAGPQWLDVQWQGGMFFDGLIAKFDKNIVATMDQHLLRTDRLQVDFQERLDFAQPKGRNAPRPAVSRARCFGPFQMEGQTVKFGSLVSMERMVGKDLLIDHRSGNYQAIGPGWLEQVQRGSVSQNLPGAASAKLKTAANNIPTSKIPTTKDGLNFLRVQFQERVQGNFRQRTATFHGDAQTAYGPVLSWDDRVDPEQLGRQGMWLRCDVMEIRQTQLGEKPSLEMDALGDVEVESRDVTALASRLSYSQAKDQLILQGDAREPARVVRAASGTGISGNMAAQSIIYWRSTGRMKWVNGRLTETAFPKTTRSGAGRPRK